ncbi:MAG: hypothetical protein ACREJT_04430, partial [Myxococcota bacterium]
EQGCAAADSERTRLVAAEAVRGGPTTPSETAAAKVEPAPVQPPVTGTTPTTPEGATAALAPSLVPEKPAKPPTGTRPVLPDRTAEKRAIGVALATWNRALNTRDWATVQAVQKLRPGQLETYQRDFAEDDVRQKLTISWIAELAPNRFETEVVLSREKRSFFVWRAAGTEKRQAIAVLENGVWRLTGL